jgi:hypothetical protein
LKEPIPACVGPKIHGGSGELRAGRLDFLDFFVSFCVTVENPALAGTKRKRLVDFYG